MNCSEKSASQMNLSAEKALTIMEYFVEQNRPLRVIDVASELKMNPSTTLRFLTTLEIKGYIVQDSDSLKYKISNKIAILANKIHKTSELNEIARPFLKELTNLTGETSCLAEERDGKLVYIEVVAGIKRTLVATQRIGNIAPLYCTGIGKTLLSHYDNEKLDNFLKINPLKKYTENTITSKQKLKKELIKIKNDKFAIDNGECDDGIRCVAVPVYNKEGDVVAGISITGPAVRMSDDKIETYLKYAIKTSKKISACFTR